MSNEVKVLDRDKGSGVNTQSLSVLINDSIVRYKYLIDELKEDVKGVIIKRIPLYYKNQIISRKGNPLCSITQLGNFKKSYDGLVVKFLANLENKEVNLAVKNFIVRDPGYCYSSVVMNLDDFLLDLVSSVIGDKLHQEKFIEWGVNNEAEVAKNKLQELGKNLEVFAGLLIDADRMKENNGQKFSHQSRPQGKEDENLGGKDVVIDSNDALIEGLRYYLRETGDEGRGKILLNNSFVLNYLRKRKPVLPGIRYLK